MVKQYELTKTAGISGLLPQAYRRLSSQARLAGSDLATEWRGEMERVAGGGKMGAVLEKENAELRQQLATIQEKCGANFEKVRFITGVQLITHDEPIECDRCKNDLPGDCELPGDDCQFEAVENA